MALIITLIVVGFILLLTELLVIPGFGITGILGILSLVGGIVLAYTSHNAVTGHITLAVTVALSAVFLYYALQPKTWNRLTLKENIDAQVDSSAESKGITVGMQGIALTRLAPMGKTRINEIEVEATAREGIINAQQKVEVVKIEGVKVIVKVV